MIYECKDCGAKIDCPPDAQDGEILSCADCGLDYVVKVNEAGTVMLQELAIEGEDWGE